MKGFKVIILAIVIFALAPISLLAQPYSNGPSDKVVIPEVIWAASTGGGTWTSNVQVTIRNYGGTNITVYFEYDAGIRGPFTIWTGLDIFESRKLYNVLQYLQNYQDTGFNYNNRVGAFVIYTQDTSHKVFATSRTLNGAYSKTVQGLNRNEAANTCNTTRELMIQNLIDNSDYRSTIAVWNETASPLVAQFIIRNWLGNLIGSPWTETINGLQYKSFDPFSKAGATGHYYNNCFLIIYGISGTGAIMAMGATANNNSNDPAYQVAVQLDY